MQPGTRLISLFTSPSNGTSGGCPNGREQEPGGQKTTPKQRALCYFNRECVPGHHSHLSPQALPPASRIEEEMYKGQSGMWSWLLHRITGLGILLFLFIHIVDVSMLGFGPEVYNQSVTLFDYWIVRLLSLALVGAVLYHAFNGIRIMAIDFWRKGSRYQRVMFWIVLAATIIVFIPMAYVIMVPAFHWLTQAPHTTAGR
ncbi:succinate dehydrogenase, cytochrome b556 subunit [Dictyobacter formicarum]|nr:succinate dehydrogenase, cytochrome b556 subunit [Dictyobacter formicarum]